MYCLGQSEFHGFKSLLVKNQSELIKKIESAIESEKVDSIDNSTMEDFLCLVCEWIEYCQTDSGDNVSTLAADDQTGGAGNGSDNGSSGNSADESAGNAPGNGSGNDVRTNDVVNNDFRIAPLVTMVEPNEKDWFIQQYIHYFSNKPRTMMRIVNTYNVARHVANDLHLNRKMDDSFYKKMLKLLILCEQWPYRMSWLMQLAEDVWQESILFFNKEHSEHLSADEILQQLKEHGLRVEDVEKGNKEEQNDVDKDATSVKNDDAGDKEKSTNRGLSPLEKMAALNAHEEKLFHFFKKVSLEDLYEHENTNRIKNYNNII